jgi:hypothetical protein
MATLESQINSVECSAKAFIRNKGAMPRDYHELAAWLVEFTAYETRMKESILKAYEEHMAVCTTHSIASGAEDGK